MRFKHYACVAFAAWLAWPMAAAAQPRNAEGRAFATYVTAEEVQVVNGQTGTDRQIISTDIGKLNLAVGVIHRGASGGAARAGGGGGGAAGAGRAGAAGGGRAAGGGGGGAAATPPVRCGVAMDPAPTGRPNGLHHDHQTETYVIISGSGQLVTGGYVVNGNQSGPTSSVTTTLNGPSCSGIIAGDDVVIREVKVGDIIIIPAGVPHGWATIPDHVDYLSIRPDPDRVLPDDYFHPSLNRTAP